jgi:hypothetical protein
MSETTRNGRSLAEMLADDALITAAITRGVRRAVLEHARAGRSVAAWKNGKVVLIPPQEILARFASESATEETPAAQAGPPAS